MTDDKANAQREAVRAGIRRKQALEIDPTLDPKFQLEEELNLKLIEDSKAGARARSERIARYGVGKGRKNQEINQKKRDAVQYRACRALLWERERILHETGWSLQWLMSIENYVDAEDRRIWSETDARVVFATYREQQLQIAKELEDLGKIFRKSKQFSALVSSCRTRAEVLDRLVKTGQELGVIHKTAKQVEISGQVDITKLDVKELRVHITRQVSEVQALLGADAPEGGASNAVMKRLEASFGEVVEAKAVEAPVKVRKVRRKRLKPKDGGSTG
jgi:hypothetical protein